jgi:predicted amidohydrolase
LLRNRVGGIVASVVISFKKIVVLTVLVLASPRVFAQGDVHDRINLLTANIAKAPRNASLFFHGHSLAVNPWGEVIADANEAIGVTLVELDLAEVAEARRRIPSLDHGRDYSTP